MSVQFTIDDRGLKRAMTTYAVMRGKSDADVVNKAMRYWLPFAAKRVKQKTPGEGKILRDLRKPPRNPIGRRFKRGKDHFGGTLAAAIIAERLKQRGLLSKKHTPGAVFWQKVENLVGAKQNSAHFLRAGFIPAFRHFNVPDRGAPNKQKYFKGYSKGIKAVPSLTGTVEAFATNQREGAFKIAPNAFRHSIRDVQRQFLRWLRADVEGTAKRSGFG